MKTETANLAAQKRLLRMRKMFATDRGILLDDYEYFTKQDEPNHPSKGRRKLVEPRGPRGPGPS
jgi:hypothetical protein